MRARRRALLRLLCALPVAWSVPAATAAPPFHIYMLLYRGMTDAEKGFMDYFGDNGIPVRFTVRDCAEDKSRLPGFVSEIKSLRPDLVYTFGTTATLAVLGRWNDKPRQGIADIPVVFDIVADPVGAGLVPSLAGSGRNLAGGSHLVPMESQLQALASATKIKSLAIIFNPAERNSLLAVNNLKGLAEKQGFGFSEYPIPAGRSGGPDEHTLRGVLLRIAADKPHILYLPSDSFVISHAATVTELAHRAGILTFSATETPVRRDGALMGLVSRYYNVGQLVAHKAEEILVQGKQPGRMPIETLSRFSFLLNMKQARILGFHPPVSIFQFAEVVGEPNAPGETDMLQRQ